jgi:hypothetical protein
MERWLGTILPVDARGFAFKAWTLPARIKSEALKSPDDSRRSAGHHCHFEN